MTNDEYIQATRQHPRNYFSSDFSSDELRAVEPPASLDWRAHRDPIVIGPVKDGGSCGDSEVIPIIDSISGGYSLLSKEDFHAFDYRYITQCSGHGCNGQYLNITWDFVNKYGLPFKFEKCPTSVVLDGICISGTNCTKPGSEIELQAAVATHGPIPVGFDASRNSFQLYKSGIYYDPQCSSTRLDHTLLIVGYGSQNGQDYWIARNTWGTAWGEKGDILLARNRNNNCGVATYACYAKDIHRCAEF